MYLKNKLNHSHRRAFIQTKYTEVILKGGKASHINEKGAGIKMKEKGENKAEQ